MAKAEEKIRSVLGSPPKEKVSLERGQEVELHLDTGDVVDATIASLRSRSGGAGRVAARSKKWTRWAGTTDDLVALFNSANTEIANRSTETAAVSIRVCLKGDDEERYFDISTFESDMQSTQSGAPGARLRDIELIEFVIGPIHAGALMAKASFSRLLQAPGVVLSLEGADRTVVSGLKAELAPMIDAGRPRIPALPGPLQMFVGGLGGIAYFFGFWRFNWDFLPNGWVGAILVELLFLSGFIALVYALTAGLRSLLPPFTLVRAGQKTQVQQWGRRTLKVGGAVAVAVLPIILQRIFGKSG